MAREGYLILDSDLHMMEPDDLWTRYLDEPFRSSNPPRFLSAQQQQLTPSSEDKGNADRIEGIEVQGLAIPAHGKSPSAAASRREVRRRSRAGHPHFAVCHCSADQAMVAYLLGGRGDPAGLRYRRPSRRLLLGL